MVPRRADARVGIHVDPDNCALAYLIQVFVFLNTSDVPVGLVLVVPRSSVEVSTTISSIHFGIEIVLISPGVVIQYRVFSLDARKDTPLGPHDAIIMRPVSRQPNVVDQDVLGTLG